MFVHIKGTNNTKFKYMAKKSYTTEIVQRLQEKYGVSRRYITMSLNGDRVSETSDSIVKDYKKMSKDYQEKHSALIDSLKKF